MMSLRSIAALAALALQLGGCAAAAGKSSATDQDADQRQRNKVAIDEMERRHTVTVENMGGGSGM